MPRESPTRMTSTPASSSRRAVGLSYAVRQVILSVWGWEPAGLDFRCRRSGTVTLPFPEFGTTLMVASGAAPYLLGRWPLSGQRDTALYLKLIKNNKLRCE